MAVSDHKLNVLKHNCQESCITLRNKRLYDSIKGISYYRVDNIKILVKQLNIMKYYQSSPWPVKEGKVFLNYLFSCFLL